MKSKKNKIQVKKTYNKKKMTNKNFNRKFKMKIKSAILQLSSS